MVESGEKETKKGRRNIDTSSLISCGFYFLEAKDQQKCDLKQSASSVVSRRTKRHMEKAKEVSWD